MEQRPYATGYLKGFLKFNYKLTIDDVTISTAPGYLDYKEPVKDRYGSQVYPTISIANVPGYGRGRYAFWRKLREEGVIHHSQ